ncbi:hypothetical protein ACSUZJ_04770 [Telluria sp. B2]
MKSSFKKKYQVVHKKDGSLELRYFARRVSSRVQALLAIVTLPVILVGSVRLALGPMNGNASSQHPLLAIILVLVWVFFCFFWLDKKEHIIFMSKEGIEFRGGKKLAFKDVRRTMLTTLYRSGGQSYIVEFDALGQSIPITQETPDEALANSILEEIRSYTTI